jgi:hypothetical protein
MAKATDTTDTTDEEIPEDSGAAPGDAAPEETPDAEPAGEPAPQSYRVLRGINYPNPDGMGEKRAEPGDLVDDLPEQSVGWLLDDGVIEKA